jgi:AAHS family 4-hydroxybenzoate transporter-like MFS transporter
MADIQAGAPGAGPSAYRHPWVATSALLLALVSEGYDLQAANFAAPALVKSLGIAKADIGPLLSASLLGVLFGAALIGSLGDRLGRKRLIIGGCLAYGLLSLAAAACSVLWELVLLRFLIGLGLGGVLPNALALASELARRGSEATAAGLIGIGITCGGVLAGLVAAALMPEYGWPSVFVVGGALPLVIVLLLWAVLPESPAYSLRRAQSKATDPWTPGPAALFRDGLAAQTVAIWVIFAAILLCVYLLSGWIPLLLNQSGFSTRSAALIGAAYQGGGVAGGVLASLMLKKRSWDVVAGFASLAAASMVFLVWGPTSTSLLVLGVVLAGFCVTGTQNAINGAGGASYEAAIRSAGLGWALGVGRLGSVAGPLVGSVAVLLGMQEPRHLFALPILPLAVAALTAAWLRRRLAFQANRIQRQGYLWPEK